MLTALTVLVFLIVAAFLIMHYLVEPTVTMTDVKSAEIEDYNAPEREARYRAEEALEAKAELLLGVRHDKHR